MMTSAPITARVQQAITTLLAPREPEFLRLGRGLFLAFVDGAALSS